MLISRDRYNRMVRRLVLAEAVADAALDRQYESTKQERLWREVHEMRYGINKDMLQSRGKWEDFE